MSDNFSWDKVLNGGESGEVQKQPTEPPSPATESVNSNQDDELLSQFLPPKTAREGSDLPKLPNPLEDLVSSSFNPSEAANSSPIIAGAPPIADRSAPKSTADAEMEDILKQLKSAPAHLMADIEVKPSELGNSSNVQDETRNPHMPAPVPQNLLSPETFVNKFRVSDELQEPGIARITEKLLPVEHIHIDELLCLAVERKASDIHLTAGLPPMVRLDGEIIPLPYAILQPEQSKRLVYEILSDEQLQKFEQTHEMDFGYAVKGVARFRVNLYVQRGAVGGALRLIPNRIPTFDELRLPSVIREISKRSSGLVLVTGPTGSGKSTTIAAMLDDINGRLQGHIMTLEDPIEYLHRHKKCIVNQRELHSDTYSLHNALRAVLREDPDIILVGELRDLETIEAALTLAETGHLVFGTLHTRNAPATIDRIIDVFPSDQQSQIKVLLANTIEGVVSQQLLPKLGGGRVASLEIMTGLPSIKNLIREGKTHQMYSVIETSQNAGMQTMDRSLSDLYRSGMVSWEECVMRAVDKESFTRLAKSA
ncbi:MAG: type IV pilus twitching motility protein PilT [Fimbriimonadaceae bacterium]|jgi:twitching motility protein PilT|nr:type IV pilus twitching motility protein PilT [Fimbriimonadaceae bacterium]